MKKLVLFFVAIVLLTITLTTTFVFKDSSASTTAISNAQVKTLPDLGNPTIAGTGAYYDDGMLKYASSGNTIGYKGDYSNTLVEFDIVFDYLQFPAWFSLTFKASASDRTQSPNLSQKGYSIAIFYNGNVEVWKPGLTTEMTGKIGGLTVGEKYRFKVGAINDGDAVRVYLSVNGVEIINALDTVNPYLTGSWFNICGDGGTSARLFSTKKEIVPDYHTYTNSTIGGFPTATDSGASYDRFKNITLGSGTVGWGQKHKDFSFETNMNWSTFGNGSNVWVALRANGFDRNNGITSGYLIRIGQVGVIEISKKGSSIGSKGSWSFMPDTDYAFEFGVVDLDENRTMVFVNVNGKPVATMIDNESPLRNAGFINFNGDGSVNCKMTSINTRLTPLKTKVSSDQTYTIIETSFYNVISHSDMAYEDFSNVTLEAMLVNDTSVLEWNEKYYASEGSERLRAIDVKFSNNKLTVKIAKTLYKTANDQHVDFEFSNLMIKKSGENKGFITPSGYVLKQTYYFSL